MAEKLRIIFYGTPDFAVKSLEEIIDAGFDVVAVVTAPDRKSGRGMKLRPSAVKAFAVSQHIPVLQPTNLKSESFQATLKGYSPNIQVVIAFRMLPESVWNYPRLGTINLHASLLPNYRGAAPINWAIINGEKHTGVTSFRLKHEIDTGNILLQQKVTIDREDNAGSLHDKLMIEGAKLTLQTLQLIENETEKELEQKPNADNKHAPKIYKEDCLIDWSTSCEDIRNLIRGLSPYPAARTTLAGKTLKIYEASIVADKKSSRTGLIESDNKSYVHVHAKDGVLALHIVQIEGKKRMTAEEFLRGFDISKIASIA
jgi:methionyl-tRNA formyltransferase